MGRDLGVSVCVCVREREGGHEQGFTEPDGGWRNIGPLNGPRNEQPPRWWVHGKIDAAPPHWQAHLDIRTCVVKDGDVRMVHTKRAQAKGTGMEERQRMAVYEKLMEHRYFNMSTCNGLEHPNDLLVHPHVSRPFHLIVDSNAIGVQCNIR